MLKLGFKTGSLTLCPMILTTYGLNHYTCMRSNYLVMWTRISLDLMCLLFFYLLYYIPMCLDSLCGSHLFCILCHFHSYLTLYLVRCLIKQNLFLYLWIFIYSVLVHKEYQRMPQKSENIKKIMFIISIFSFT